MDELQWRSFMVHETPYCIWGWDLHAENTKFIAGLDIDYYVTLVAVHEPMLEGELSQYAALTLRSAYSQSMERFFALLSASLQAPDCVYGWLLKYSVKDLREAVRAIATPEGHLINLLGLAKPTWQTIADVIIPTINGNLDKSQQIKKAFAGFWARLAEDFLDEETYAEYNSIKHGMRILQGGFSLDLGVDLPEDARRLFAGSKYGSMYPVLYQLSDRTNLGVTSRALNWNPSRFIHALKLIALSEAILIGFLKWRNDMDVTAINFEIPSIDYFEEPWKHTAYPNSMYREPRVTPNLIHPFSQKEIRDLFRNLENE